MSDAPQGEGWWQASDLKWYPPQDDGSRVRSASGGRWILPAALGVVIALIAAAATFFVVSRDTADASTVTLEPVAATGADPFTTSTTITEVADFPDSVKAVTTQLTSTLHTNPTTGTLTTTGTTPGLYGGTRDNATCDSQALTDYLTKNPAKAKAWAQTQGIDVNDIADYIAGLTSAVLTTDTLVTNHGYKNGGSTRAPQPPANPSSKPAPPSSSTTPAPPEPAAAAATPSPHPPNRNSPTRPPPAPPGPATKPTTSPSSPPATPPPPTTPSPSPTSPTATPTNNPSHQPAAPGSPSGRQVRAPAASCPAPTA